jgi:putative phosphoserine phosphatase/1-acylglycerol-3-phosphate O-acyltransferase
MPKINELISAIEAAPKGAKTAALFDFDGTIIYGYSAFHFLRAQVTRGDLDIKDLMATLQAMTQFGFGNIDFASLIALTAQFMAGYSKTDYDTFAQTVYDKHIGRLVYPEARKLIDAHKAAGHTIAIVSSATRFQVEPAAQDLGIDHVYCTELAVNNDTFTGEIDGLPCFGMGKVAAAKQLLKRTKGRLANTFFYSDSTDDSDLLLASGHPVALNPSRALREMARENQWAQASFDSRGTPTLSQFIRSLAATGSVVSAFAAGIPVLALTGSMRQSRNFSYALFAETASALVGLELDVQGEANIWKQRPAVFIFNHQSKTDVIIATKLVRQDMAGIGKKEIKKLPIIGKVMEWGGVVMIDRKNAESAIAAMKPLVDVMQNEGKSVVLAPEGTRSTTRKLGAFKKGAFHLAMQAGVPIVPIVIHNASDIAPKGDFVFRPGKVKVEVLDPIDTETWRLQNLDQHIQEVRQLYLEALGQTEPAANTPARSTRGLESSKPRVTKTRNSLAKSGATGVKETNNTNE